VRESTKQTNRIDICFQTLDLRIGVRIPASQPILRNDLLKSSDKRSWTPRLKSVQFSESGMTTGKERRIFRRIFRWTLP